MLRYVKLEILDLQPGNFKIETIHPIILTFGLFYLKYVKDTNSRDDKAFVWLDSGQDAVSKGRPMADLRAHICRGRLQSANNRHVGPLVWHENVLGCL